MARKMSQREKWVTIFGINCRGECSYGKMICCSECQLRGICLEKCEDSFNEDCYGKGILKVET